MLIHHWRFLIALMLRFARVEWLVPAVLIAFCVVPVVAGIVRLAELASGAAITPENALI